MNAEQVIRLEIVKAFGNTNSFENLQKIYDFVKDNKIPETSNTEEVKKPE